MNLILLEPAELDGGRASIGGRRAKHIAAVHRAAVGTRLQVGILGGLRGSGIVVAVDPDRVVLDVEVGEAPPPPLPCTLVLALPRPLVLGRVLGAVASFGIKRIVLFASLRVEKSYWQSPMLEEAALRDALVLGLEQAGDTTLPVVEIERRFRPFVEDRLAAQVEGSLALVAEAGAADPCPRAVAGPVTLVVGPEGGFVDFELRMLAAAGLTQVSLGVRPLRVEHAVAALVGRLF